MQSSTVSIKTHEADTHRGHPQTFSAINSSDGHASGDTTDVGTFQQLDLDTNVNDGMTNRTSHYRAWTEPGPSQREQPGEQVQRGSLGALESQRNRLVGLDSTGLVCHVSGLSLQPMFTQW